MITCFFENGSKIYLRHVCVSAIIVKENKILLVKRGTYLGKKIPEYGKWALIGGYLERDETLVQGLKREVKEETGFSIKNLRLFRINDNPHRPNEDKQNIEFVFIAQPGQKTQAKNEEVLEQKWFDLNKLPPQKQIAFDHFQTLSLYKKYCQAKFPLPI